MWVARGCIAIFLCIGLAGTIGSWAGDWPQWAWLPIAAVIVIVVGAIERLIFRKENSN